jgi:hypothetical protein
MRGLRMMETDSQVARYDFRFIRSIGSPRLDGKIEMRRSNSSQGRCLVKWPQVAKRKIIEHLPDAQQRAECLHNIHRDSLNLHASLVAQAAIWIGSWPAFASPEVPQTMD